MFSVGYWMFSNRQMFENHVHPNVLATPQFEHTDHVIFRNIASGPAIGMFI